jgi:hypothetical protein
MPIGIAQTPNYAINPTPELDLRSNRAILPARVIAALGLMDRTDVTRLIIDRASRFGAFNPQQLRQLQERLSKEDQPTVVRGLLDVFVRCDVPPKGSAAQELAGTLLETALLQAPESLEDYLYAVLPLYELSVEQLPKYLARAIGLKTILVTLDRIESEEQRENVRRAIKTMRFWLGVSTGGDQND